MARRNRPRRSKQISDIPKKPELEVSGTSIAEYEHTDVPSLSRETRGLQNLKSGTTYITSDQDDDAEIYAPVLLPRDLSISLAPVDLVYRLEEYRSDERGMAGAFWTFLGILASYLIERFKSGFTDDQVLIAVLLSVFCAVFWGYKRQYGLRAKKKMNEIRSSIVASGTTSPQAVLKN